MIKLFTLVFVSLGINTSVHAWGKVGHQVVGDLAEKLLTDKAKRRVRSLLGADDLGDVSTWADKIRGQSSVRAQLARKFFKWTGPKPERVVNKWHYMTVADRVTYRPDMAPAEGDTYKAIVTLNNVLRSSSWSPKDKKEALMLLVHFIGDLHQPLHIGNGTDRGGNRCLVNWFPKAGRHYFSEGALRVEKNYQNLHKVWDSLIFEKLQYSRESLLQYLLQPNPVLMGFPDPQRIKAYQRMSRSKLKQAFGQSIRYWQNSKLSQWIAESLKWRFKAYPDQDSRKTTGKKYCKYSEVNPIIDPRNIPLIQKESSKLFQYMRYLAELRVLQGGVRLAQTLNYVFR
jgi:hypothetical protein